jgi:hypothetical protein
MVRLDGFASIWPRGIRRCSLNRSSWPGHRLVSTRSGPAIVLSFVSMTRRALSAWFYNVVTDLLMMPLRGTRIGPGSVDEAGVKLSSLPDRSMVILPRNLSDMRTASLVQIGMSTGMSFRPTAHQISN